MLYPSAIALSLIATATLVAQQQSPLRSEQNWDDNIRHRFWYVDQGSRIMPYAWFDQLEQAGRSQQKFRHGLERYGFIPDTFGIKGSLNSANLPIGFSVSAQDKWVGLNCAGCHTGQITLGAQRYMIEGAPSMLNFDLFLSDVVDAMQETLKDDGKARRFFTSGLADARPAFVRQLASLAQRRAINTPDTPAGFARVDAFGHIFNQVIVEHLKGDSANKVKTNAPASYPALWDISQHRYVQWNYSAPNLGVGRDAPGSLSRNIGEVLGVFGTLTITRTPGLLADKWTYQSSANLDNLQAIEDWIEKLRAPSWPFSKIEDAKMEAGRKIYDAECVSCHKVIDPRNPPFPYPASPYLVEQIKTERLMAQNISDAQAPSGILQGAKIVVRPRAFFATFGERASVAEMTAQLAAGISMPKVSAAAGLRASLQVFIDGRLTDLVYKARPLNGIWATAPYLHNGSVPNLWELLQAGPKRMDQFCVGDGQYDEVNVGFQTYRDRVANCPPRTSVLDTSKDGNKNCGHDYGTQLPDADKWALIAFLKSL